MDDINQIILSYIEDNLIKNKDILTNHIYQKVSLSSFMAHL